MAVSISYAFFLSLTLRASLSFPIFEDAKTLQLSVSAQETELSERTPVLRYETILKPYEELKLMQSLATESVPKAFESFEADHGKRVKRAVANSPQRCSSDTVQHLSGCVSKARYIQEYGEVPEDAESDYSEET